MLHAQSDVSFLVMSGPRGRSGGMEQIQGTCHLADCHVPSCLFPVLFEALHVHASCHGCK